MPAYAVPIPVHRCQCGKAATREVRDYNGHVGYCCRQCAYTLVNRLNAYTRDDEADQ